MRFSGTEKQFISARRKRGQQAALRAAEEAEDSFGDPGDFGIEHIIRSQDRTLGEQAARDAKVIVNLVRIMARIDAEKSASVSNQ
jgi:hypothetical protein